jgi:hypothetical protein
MICGCVGALSDVLETVKLYDLCGEVRLVVRGCVVIVRCVLAICVNGIDTLLLHTVVICGEYSWVGAEIAGRYVCLSFHVLEAYSVFTVGSKNSARSCLHNEDYCLLGCDTIWVWHIGRKVWTKVLHSFLAKKTFRIWSWRNLAFPKRWFTYNKLYGITS